MLYQQPQFGTRLAEPFAKHCVHALLGHAANSTGVYDAATGSGLTINAASGGTITPGGSGVGKIGRYFRTDASTVYPGGYVTLGNALAARQASGRVTMVAVIERTSGGGYAMLGAPVGTAVGSGDLAWQWYTDNKHYFDVSNESQRVALTDASTGPVVLVLSWDNTSKTKRIWSNGALIAEDTADPDSLTSTASVYSALANGVPTYLFAVFDNVWGKATEADLCRNPWQIFADPADQLTLVSVSGIISRPSSDVTTAGWTASTGADLYACIDEVSLDRADFITSPAIPGAGSYVANLTPNRLAGTWQVDIDARWINGASQLRIHMQDSGGSDVGVSSWQSLTNSDATYSLNITTTGTATRIAIEVQ